MKVLVTGGAGYVGSHCVRALCDAGHGVVVLDNLSQGHRRAVDERAAFVAGDLADHAVLGAALRDGGFDAVIHFAACLDVSESVRLPLKYYDNNVVNTVHLLRLMAQVGIQRFVFSSSCAVYGVPQACPIVEENPKDPINPYGRTKLAIEWVMRDSAAAWGLGGCALRYFNAAGAAADALIGEDHDPEIHLVPIVLQVALGRRDHVNIFGIDYPTPDGTCLRDYVHIEDLAAAHVLALETVKAGTFRHYNIGTGEGTSVRQIIDAAREVTGHDIPAVTAPRRAGDPPALFADPSKIKTELGWKPEYTDIVPIIETAWRWHHSHPQGFDR